MNPSIAVGPSHFGGADRVYVVWQDRRNGNDDVYLVRSNDGGLTWNDNYFVTDDPHMTWQNQVAPSVAVENLGGWVVVGWEDWRDPDHPEVYAMWSKYDEGETFGIDVPVTIVPPEFRTTYRVEPSLAAQTTVEKVEFWDPVAEITRTEVTSVTVIHAAWQEGQGDDADVYYAYASWVHNREARKACPWPYGIEDFCFDDPQKVNGFVLDSDYVRPPDSGPTWPIEPSWQGQVSLDLVPDGTYTTRCHFTSTIDYSRGVMIAWSDARSYDDWRYEIRTRRAASPEGDPESFEVCEEGFVGMVNSNAKLFAYRDDLDQYEIYKPAATRQINPYICVDQAGIYVAWDDDRWDEPLEPNSVRNRDVFFARMGSALDGIYISPVIDSHGAEPKWYVLSWWGATEHLGDLLFQTRFGNSVYPPQQDIEANTWTRWTGNPSSPYLGCSAGVGCYYDAPGRHIVRPDGTDWFSDPDHPDQYRYIQYKVIIRHARHRLTAVSQVTIHYQGPYEVYLPLTLKGF